MLPSYKPYASCCHNIGRGENETDRGDLSLLLDSSFKVYEKDPIGKNIPMVKMLLKR